MNDPRDRRFFVHGFLLIVTALVIGLFVQRMPNPRMGLATHLEALLLGMLLVLVGLVWQRLSLPSWARTWLSWLPLVGAYCSVSMHLFAAIYPAGQYWMPIAAAGLEGTAWQELLITIANVLIGATMLPAMLIGLWGMLRAKGADPSSSLSE